MCSCEREEVGIATEQEGLEGKVSLCFSRAPISKCHFSFSEGTSVLIVLLLCLFQKSFLATDSTSGKVAHLVSNDCGVYVAMESGPIVRVFHAITHCHLLDIDISSSVQQMLSGELHHPAFLSSSNSLFANPLNSTFASAIFSSLLASFPFPILHSLLAVHRKRCNYSSAQDALSARDSCPVVSQSRVGRHQCRSCAHYSSSSCAPESHVWTDTGSSTSAGFVPRPHWACPLHHCRRVQAEDGRRHRQRLAW